MKSTFSRRDVLKAGTALTATTLFAEPIRAAAPPAEAVTPALITAAKKEGKVIHYTSVDLPLAEKVAKSFEAKYPGIAVRIERTGAERVFTRIAQERGSNIHACDVVQSSDAAHFVVWKRDGILEAYVPEEVAQHYPPEHRDPDGLFASYRVYLCCMGYNTSLVKAEDAPQSFADILDPKWKGKIVKAHPNYSGTILTATYQTARDIGWGYYEKLAQQSVLQVQSASDPPKKLALGERSIMADGIEYGIFQLKEKGQAVDALYPKEGTAADHRAERYPQERAQSQRRTAVPELHAVGGVPAVQRRVRRASVRARAGQGQGRAQADEGHQDHEGRRRRGREGQRRDQGPLHQAVQGLRYMMRNRFSRRDVLKGSGALALGLSSTTKVLSAAPPATAVTPALIEAAKKEGKVVYYTSVDLPLAEKIAKAFEAKYPGVAVRVERTGAERVFQRIGQEYGSRIHAVDVVNSSDASHFIVWKRDGILQPYVPEDVAKYYPTDHKEADGLYASFRIGLCIIAYNTNLVKKEDAPKSFADLLDPKWKGKILKAHPGYSGTIMTATFEMQRDLGWDYLEKLAKQNVMQLQSSADPPKKLALGERAVQADGNEYNIFQIKEIRRPGRAGLCDRGHAAGGRAERHLQGCAQSERGAAVPVASASPANASSSSPMSAASARCIRRSRRRPAASRSRRSRP